jgi:uncharacterized protein YdeI (YjbR/CyaY-like superfamily)
LKIQSKPKFFSSPTAFRKWLATHHATAEELWVGFYKKGSGKASITWPESVDQALCFGWIDGLRKRIDEISYTIRFTPRRRGSIWSAVNIKRVSELEKSALMTLAGLNAFAERTENKSGIYSYEQRPEHLDGVFAKKFKANKPAWEFYQAQGASYRRAANWWIISAKKVETKLRRLETLIEHSAQGKILPQYQRTPPARLKE